MEKGIKNLSQTYPSHNTGESGVSFEGRAPEPEKSLKAPGSITEQVLVGLLNDVFTSCVFRSVPKIDSNPVPLTSIKSDPKESYYMLSLKWSKSGVLIQSISHPFTVFSGVSRFSQDKMTRYGERGSLISLGLFTALKIGLKEPCDSHKIPVSILKNYINKDINKGGYWAYMCSPVFLNANTSESSQLSEQQDRTVKLIKLAGETLDVICPTTILSLLWSLYYTNSYHRLKGLCNVLLYEFLSNYSDYLQDLVYLLYLCQRMGIVSDGWLEELINSKFNNVTALESLTISDVVVLTNVVEFNKSSGTIGQKISTILYYHVDSMSSQCVVYLLKGLHRLNFNFRNNDLFTKKLMSRLLSVYDDITSGEILEVLFNTLSIMPYNVVGYFNELISKTLTRLHKLTAGEIGYIGRSYATANNTLDMLKEIELVDESAAKEIKNILAGNLPDPASGHIYHCLEYHFRKDALEFRGVELDLLKMIHESLIYNSQFQFSVGLNKKKFEYGKVWFESFPFSNKISSSKKPTTKTDAKALEAESNNPAYQKSFKMFFLNLIDDCCNNNALFDITLIDQVVFSLLTLKIDLSPINETMLASKGELIKNAGGILEINIIEYADDMKNQYRMAKEIMSWSRVKQGGDGMLVLSGILVDDDSFDVLVRDVKKLKESPKQAKGETKKSLISIKSMLSKEGSKAANSAKNSFELPNKIPVKPVEREEIKMDPEVPMKPAVQTTAEPKMTPNFEKTPNNVNSEEYNLNELMKMAAKLGPSSLQEGNPIYELLKSYTSAKSQAPSIPEPAEEDSWASPDQGDKTRNAPTHKGKDKSASIEKKGKKGISTEDDWVNLRSGTAKPAPKETEGIKIIKPDKRAYEVFYRVKKRTTTRMELAKREIQIIYKYLKIKK